jgi:hypothetical protein
MKNQTNFLKRKNVLDPQKTENCQNLFFFLAKKTLKPNRNFRNFATRCGFGIAFCNAEFLKLMSEDGARLVSIMSLSITL